MLLWQQTFFAISKICLEYITFCNKQLLQQMVKQVHQFPQSYSPHRIQQHIGTSGIVCNYP